MGGVLMVIPTEALSDAPWLYAAVRVMVWLPAPRVALKDSPVPIGPSRLDVHIREAPVSAPSPGSVPVPLKGMLTEGRKVEPPVGLMISAGGDEGRGGGAPPVAKFQKALVPPLRRA